MIGKMHSSDSRFGRQKVEKKDVGLVGTQLRWERKNHRLIESLVESRFPDVELRVI